jgi:hypothetical protein
MTRNETSPMMTDPRLLDKQKSIVSCRDVYNTSSRPVADRTHTFRPNYLSFAGTYRCKLQVMTEEASIAGAKSGLMRKKTAAEPRVGESRPMRKRWLFWGVCVLLAVSAVLVSRLPQRPKCSAEDFARIEDGMSHEEVERILGGPPGT